MLSFRKTPETVVADGARVWEHAARIAADPTACERLRQKADEVYDAPDVVVTKRKMRAASGDVHDYCSFGPYWWPNPETSDGMPYIRRDGEVNPDTRDRNGFGTLFPNVRLLTLAALILGEERYAARAVRQLRAWYLDPETAMNPNLTHGQAIPGQCDGRGIGLIDCSGSYELFDAVAILDAMGAIDAETLGGLKAWYGAFVDWMLTSEIGLQEDVAHNNHGTWYDVQVAATALFLGREMLAAKTLSLAYERRIAKHIEPDGSQPHELARTRAFHYSLYNLKASVVLGLMGEKLKKPIDLFHIPRAEGDFALRAAIDFLLPYAADLTGFAYPDISGPNASGTATICAYADRAYPERGYAEAARRLNPDPLAQMLPYGV